MNDESWAIQRQGRCRLRDMATAVLMMVAMPLFVTSYDAGAFRAAVIIFRFTRYG